MKKFTKSLLMVLFVLVLVSTFLLVSRLMQVTEIVDVFALNLPDSKTQDSQDQTGDNATPKDGTGTTGSGAGGGSGSNANGGSGQTDTGNSADTALITPDQETDFVVRDEDEYYSSEATVDIFSVNSSGEKQIQPGSSGSYQFLLQNQAAAALDFQVLLESLMTVGGRNLTIPVEVKLYNDLGEYVLGSEDTWAPVLELNQVGDSGVLSSGRSRRYTLLWQWPFEDGTVAWDDNDTTLGDLAEGETLSLYIGIHTLAVADTNPNAEGGTPYTGDDRNIRLWAILWVSSLSVLLLLLFCSRKKEDDHET